MPRQFNPDLSIDWKVVLPATLGGTVEAQLFDKTTGKPRYGVRSLLINYLLARWLKDLYGITVEVQLPPPDLIPDSYLEATLVPKSEPVKNG